MGRKKRQLSKVLWVTDIKLLFPQPVWIVGILENTTYLVLMCVGAGVEGVGARSGSIDHRLSV